MATADFAPLADLKAVKAAIVDLIADGTRNDITAYLLGVGDIRRFLIDFTVLPQLRAVHLWIDTTTTNKVEYLQQVLPGSRDALPSDELPRVILWQYKAGDTYVVEYADNARGVAVRYICGGSSIPIGFYQATDEFKIYAAKGRTVPSAYKFDNKKYEISFATRKDGADVLDAFTQSSQVAFALVHKFRHMTWQSNHFWRLYMAICLAFPSCRWFVMRDQPEDYAAALDTLRLPVAQTLLTDVNMLIDPFGDAIDAISAEVNETNPIDEGRLWVVKQIATSTFVTLLRKLKESESSRGANPATVKDLHMAIASLTEQCPHLRKYLLVPSS